MLCHMGHKEPTSQIHPLMVITVSQCSVSELPYYFNAAVCCTATTAFERCCKPLHEALVSRKTEMGEHFSWMSEKSFNFAYIRQFSNLHARFPSIRIKLSPYCRTVTDVEIIRRSKSFDNCPDSASKISNTFLFNYLALSSILCNVFKHRHYKKKNDTITTVKSWQRK